MTARTDASDFLRKGQAHQFSEPADHHAAEIAYRASIRIAPHWGEPYHWLGFALESQGLLEEAADAYRRACELLTDDPRPLIALGRLRTALHQYVEAIKLLEIGLTLRPHYAEADARLFLADALDLAGKVERAAVQWRIVSQMKPSYPSRDKPMKAARQKLAAHGLTESSDDGELVKAYLRHHGTKDDAFLWSWQTLQRYLSEDPSRAWILTLKLIAAAPDEAALAYVAAGPLEDLLYGRGELFIDEVERTAQADPKFLSALQMISGPFTKEANVAERIVKAAGVPIRFADQDWPEGTP
ncbi:MAG: hypothetical protein JSS29_19865 [Proteobacteria bacterium]|nr:hypothetical protein [Pseudomonadota bacterium]